MHEKLQIIVTQNSLSCAWSWPKSILFVCSFSPTFTVVFFVVVKKCEIPRQKPLDDSLAMNSISLKKLISRGGRQGGITVLPFGSMVKIQSLAEFPVDHVSHQVTPRLVLFQCQFAAFLYHLIRFLCLISYPYLPNPSARAGYDTRSIFKRSLTGLNSEFSFS